MSSQPQPNPSGPNYLPDQGLMVAVAEQLIPLFKTEQCDTAFARNAARCALDHYQPETGADYVNIARSLAFSMTALTLLGHAASADMTIPEKMRLLGRANALNRSADQSERTMMRRRHYQNTTPRYENQPQSQRAAARPEADLPKSDLPEPDLDAAMIEAAVAETMAIYTQTKTGLKADAPSPPAAPQPAASQPAASQPAASRPAAPAIDLGPPPAPVSAIHYNGAKPAPKNQPEHRDYAAMLRAATAARDQKTAQPRPG